VEVVEGDVSLPAWGSMKRRKRGWQKSLDLIVNSAGLTISILICAMQSLPTSIRRSICSFSPKVQSRRADASFDLLRCRHVRRPVTEELRDNYNPATMPNSTPKREIDSLRETIRRVEDAPRVRNSTGRFAARRWTRRQ